MACGNCYHGGSDIDVWVMKDYSVKECWTKELEIRDLDGGSVPPQVLDFTKEGRVLLWHDSKLKASTSGRLDFQTVEVDGIQSEIQRVCVHIPSFLSLKDVIGG